MDIKKVKKHARKKMVKIVPNNLKYKANSVFSNEAGFKGLLPKGVDVFEIYPDLTTSLEINPKFNQHLSGHSIYDSVSGPCKNIYTVNTNYLVASIKNGRIYSDNEVFVAVTNQENVLLEDVSHLLRNSRGGIENTAYFKRKFFIKPKHIPGCVLNLLSGGGAAWNYGHWLIDSLARIHLVKKAGLFHKIDYVLVPDYSIDYQIESLYRFGITKDKIIKAGVDTHITADVLVSTTNPRGKRSMLIPQWVYDFLQKELLDDIENGNYPEYIYISRSDSKKRIVTNEKELIDRLKKYGFESIVLSNFNIKQKIDLFRSAKIIVSASGAALSNLFFCKPNAALIEIFPENFVHSIFYNIANLGRINYDFLISKAQKEVKGSFEANYEDITVDLDELEGKIIDIVEV